MAPKELYISIERTYETKDGTIIGMVMLHESRTSEDDIKYLRSDLAVDREKLVRDMENMRDSIKALKIDNDFNDGRLAILEELIEKLKEL